MARKNQHPPRVYTNTTASCSKCNSMKPFSEFSQCKGTPMGISYWCKSCASSNARKHHARKAAEDPLYRESKRNGWLKRAHGITLDQYRDRLEKQNFSCAICSQRLEDHGTLTHLDHCHTSGKLRSFLCTNCNRGLGHFKDSEQLLEEAMKYLRSHKERGQAYA